jgi:tetratricopeptide (TPR) repeat protein
MLSTHWMRAGDYYVRPSWWVLAWILTKHVLTPIVDLLFFIWTLKLLWKQRFFAVQWVRLTNAQQARFVAIFLAGTAIVCFVPFPIRAVHSLYAAGTAGDLELLLFAVWVTSFCWVAHRNAKRGEDQTREVGEEPTGRSAALRRWWRVRETRLTALTLLCLILVIVPAGDAGSRVYSVAVLVLLLMIVWSGPAIILLATSGRNQAALIANRAFSWVPGHAKSFQGWISLEAGHFDQALSQLRPLAFETDGRPSLASWDLYLYSTALSNDGKEAAAQELFEAAIQVHQQHRNFHYGLADCLLSQGKDPGRAIELINEALADGMEEFTAKQKRASRGRGLALQAWALASSGLRADAEFKLQEAVAVSGTLGKHDMAGLMHLKGIVLKSLGDKEAARTAFGEFLRLFPHGALKVWARRRLAELDESGEGPGA